MGCLWAAGALACAAAEAVPDRLVALTFDDAVASHYTVVRPLLKRFGFGATFFITEGFSFRTNKADYLTWEQIAELHRDGFEIGNHTRDHLSVTAATLPQLRDQVEAIASRCAEYGIPRPASFAYPGNAIHPGALPILRELGITLARRGGGPEHAYEWGRGTGYDPALDHPLLIPSAGDARPDWTLADFQRAVNQATNGLIAVLQFHGVPDREHPWVHTPPARFEQYLGDLHARGFRVVALRDLAPYAAAQRAAADPFAVIAQRQAAREDQLVNATVVDAATEKPVSARVYLQGSDGRWHFAKSAALQGHAVRYERRNAQTPEATEVHTTVSAHPFRFEVPPGRYTLTVERGKEYFAATQAVEVAHEPVAVRVHLRRWIDMAARGWYAGDTHVHRALDELPSAQLAEDVNVVLPMVQWTTAFEVPPNRSQLNLATAFGSGPVTLDATHVYDPRNTEYEIFRVGGRSHTLGAFLVMKHTTPFDLPAMPLAAIGAQARAQGALIDLEKHNWPWSMALIPILNVNLFELANNHHWRTVFGLRNWAQPAPPWMALGDQGTGLDTERSWTHYGLRNYYALLNCGFRLQPTAGTANGVHPVPLGFSRVYVQLPQGFSYPAWMDALAAGRSFVTTGPMLFARVEGQAPGHVFRASTPGAYRVEGEVLSETPLETLEIVTAPGTVHELRPANERTTSGAVQNRFSTVLQLDRSSWLVVRCFESRPDGRMRFAHTAPWHVEVAARPLRPVRREAEWLLGRVREELARSREVLPPAGVAEYEAALRAYEAIAARAE
jgi:peptidoglycan/xylan/chitin deacetylase (PgdA/CDA1 family)